MTSWLPVLRHVLRSLGRSHGYALTVVAILALGIGANAAIFSAVHAVLLRPLPFSEPERLVRLWETYSRGKGRGTVSYENFQDWSAEADRIEAMGAYWLESRNLQGVGEPERLRALESTASLWTVLGAQPLAGRLFTESEELDEGARVVVLGERFWQRRFAADRAVLGSALLLDGAKHTIIGILPGRLRFPNYGEAPDIYLPHRPSPTSGRGNHYLSVVGRLRTGSTLEGARTQLESIAERLEREYPDNQAGRSVHLQSLSESIRGRVRPLLLVLLAAVVAVLAIACANLAGLGLARAESLRRSAAIRAALGASRSRLVGEQLAQSTLLVLAGSCAGALLARSMLAFARPAIAAVLPDLGPLTLDRAVLGFLLATSAATGVGIGLAPAVAVVAGSPSRGLGVGSHRVAGDRLRHRARRVLVAAQIALTLTLLLGAGLLLRTFVRLQATAPGFDRVGVLTLHLSPSASTSELGDLAPKLMTPVLERVRAIEGVEAAGVVSILPVQNWGSNTSYSIDGLEPPEPGEEWWVEHRAASPGMFEALGVPLRAGRPLDEADGGIRDPESEAPLPAIVNETFARRHFESARDAIGRRVNVWGLGVDIVGVVGDVHQAGLDREPRPELTVAYNDARVEPIFDDVVLVVRSSLPTAALTTEIRAAMREVAPAQPLHTIRTLDEVLAASLAERRLTLGLVAVFALAAAALAGTGLYALIAYLVALRRREIGVRMALGATASRIRLWVLAEGIAVASVGIVLGLFGGWSASRLVASQLHAVGPLDPWTWTAVVASTLALAAGASLSPALRASRTDLSSVLRED